MTRPSTHNGESAKRVRQSRAKRKPGRKSTYSAALMARICARLEVGETMADICRGKGMPAARTVYAWRDERPNVAASIARARQVGFDAIADSCMGIADAPNVVELPDGTKETRDPQRDKLRVWTRLQLLAKWDPKRYGDKVQTEHSGSVTINRQVFDGD